MKEKIAVIGSGISGLACSWLLREKYNVTLYEKKDYFGGHSNTLFVDDKATKLAVDTGFIVFNKKNYPNLSAFFNLLDVKTQKSEMTFSVEFRDKDYAFKGTLKAGINSLLRQTSKPSFLYILKNMCLFNDQSKSFINKVDTTVTFKEFCNELNIDPIYYEYYLYPMIASIWSSPYEKINDYPAYFLLKFMYNHGLLNLVSRPQWRTVTGGSRQYVDRILLDLNDVRKNREIKKIIRLDNKVNIIDLDNKKETYDKVIIATHADQILQLLEKPSQKEQKLLSQFQYEKNIVTLHNDEQIMPKDKTYWASWNYGNSGSEEKKIVHLTYWMNKLQRLKTTQNYFVSVNLKQNIDSKKIIKNMQYTHPIYKSNSLKTQQQIRQIQGQNNTYFVGSYMGYGFHEDGLQSAMEVSKKLGITIPWEQ